MNEKEKAAQDQMNDALAQTLFRRDELENWATEQLGIRVRVKLTVYSSAAEERPLAHKRLLRAVLGHEWGDWAGSDSAWWAEVRAPETRWGEVLTVYAKRERMKGFRGLLRAVLKKWNARGYETDAEDAKLVGL